MTWASTQEHRSPAARALALARPLLAALLLIGALALLWLVAGRCAMLLSYPYPADGLEGTLLYEARLLRAGEPLYQPLERYRFVSAPYPPFHPLLLAQVDRLAGPHIFWSGRLISLCAALAVALTATLLVRALSGSWSAAALATAIMISTPPFFLWATRIKPDLLALLCTALGLALATWAMTGRGRAATLRLVAAALCFALAFLTKQTAVAAPLATGLALLLNDLLAWRRPPDAGRRPLPLSPQTLTFTAAYLTLALGTWALLDQIYAGQYTLHVWWGGDRTRWWSLALFLKLAGLLLAYWPLLLLGACAAIIGLGRRSCRVLACYALVVPLALSAAGETGANHNHLLETLLAYSLGAGTLLGWQLARRPAQPRGGARRARLVVGQLATAALVIAQVWLLFQPQPWYGSELDPALRGSPERFVAFMRATPGEILADDPGLLLIAGKPVRYDDPSTMGPAAAIGKWDQRGLLDDIANQRFSAIMIPVNVRNDSTDPAGRWTPEALAAIKRSYKRLYADQLITYVPR
jgi:hypothetical protein